MRLLVRRTRWSARHVKKLTPFELKTGWRYQIIATNIGRMHGIAGSHHPQWLDVLHRAHAGVEDRVRTNKNMGLAKLPSSAWTVNCGWILAANLAADIDAWTRLLGLHDHDDLNQAEPDTLRYRVWHLPAKLTCHARTRTLAISREWPWREAFLTCWNRLTSLPAPARRADHHRDNEEGHPHLRPPMVNTTSCCMHWPRSRTRVTHAGVRYPLAGLLTMAVCAVLAGPHRSPRSATGCTIWTPMPDPVWDSPVEYRWARRCDGC